MTRSLLPFFPFLRAGLATLAIWPIALVVADVIRSWQIQGAPGFVVRRSEQPGCFWFTVLGFVFLKGLAALAAAFFFWIAVRNCAA